MDLANKKCVPCEGGANPMGAEEVEQYLRIVTGWALADGPEIRKGYKFKDFAQALAFVNMVGAIAETEGHHPDIFLHGWNQVELRLSTHAIHGLHLNDFVLASKVDALWKRNFTSTESK
jgi:4a-hydroxytetrahydrobiopterin dehydratase